jgi:hypothetical protein
VISGIDHKYMNEIDANQGRPTEFPRLQFDFEFKF